MKAEFDKQGAQDRLRKAVYYLIGERVVDNDKDIATAMGANDNTVWQATSGNEKYLTLNFLKRFCDAFPVINIDYLKGDDSEMLKPGVNVTHGKNSPVVTGSATSGGVVAGAVSGTVTVNHNGGKDQVIEKQEQQVHHMFEAFMVELRGFHEYTQRQDDHLDNIVKKSYLRNERNMERIDKMIEQQNNLIRMVVEQNQRTQDRADRLLGMLEKKL